MDKMNIDALKKFKNIEITVGQFGMKSSKRKDLILEELNH